jgi:hypothetical protein
VHFEAYIVVEIGRTGKDFDWVLDTLEECLALQNIASVVAFGDYLSRVEGQAAVDAVTVEDVVAAEFHGHQSLESRVEVKAELVEVATSGSVVRSCTDLLVDPCLLEAGLC